VKHDKRPPRYAVPTQIAETSTKPIKEKDDDRKVYILALIILIFLIINTILLCIYLWLKLKRKNAKVGEIIPTKSNCTPIFTTSTPLILKTLKSRPISTLVNPVST
jgi:hypothetical protein